jgi:polysaccharide export outer membrane protein
MPVRSKGWLLAGTGAVLGLCVSGIGCQSRQLNPLAMAPATPAVTVEAPSPVVVASASASSATPAVIAASPAPKPRFSFFRRSRPAVEMQAPVVQQADARTTAAAQGMSVIASSWRGMERDNPTRGPAVETQVADATPVAASSLQQTAAGTADASRPTDTPWHAVVLTSSSTATQTDKPATPGVEPLPASESLPAARLVPQPVQTAPPQVIARAHYHYPSHAHEAAATPPIPAVPREFEKQSLPPYVVEPPDILLINASNAITLPTQPLIGQHLVRPDGTINLGIYGSVYVAGLTLEQIQDVVASVLKARHARRKGEDGKPAEREMTVDEIKLELQVDVLAYNSKVYYIITDGGGYGEQVYRISATGNETVLDALSQINGLPAVASKKRIWVARATPDHAPPLILPVDWCGIVKNGSAATNYQIFPGDRVYVNSDALIRTDSALGKFLAPIERTLGTVLLGSSTVNSIRNSNGTGNGSNIP